MIKVPSQQGKGNIQGLLFRKWAMDLFFFGYKMGNGSLPSDEYIVMDGVIQNKSKLQIRKIKCTKQI